MPEADRRANRARSKVRSAVENVFAEQKAGMGLFIRTVGIARATIKIGLANLVTRNTSGARGTPTSPRRSRYPGKRVGGSNVLPVYVRCWFLAVDEFTGYRGSEA